MAENVQELSCNSLHCLRIAGEYEQLVRMGEYLACIMPSDPNVYEELCIGYYHTGNKRKSYTCIEKIFQLRPRDSAILNRAVVNKKLFEKNFVEEHWTPSFVPEVGTYFKVVTVTVTSCKRLPLFIRTMDSFLRCCVDKSIIKEFVCFDDNSCDDDRMVMTELFPFMRFTFKTADDRGHARSMQLIGEYVSKDESQDNKSNTPFVFHLEDDWLFINRLSLSDLIEIMKDNQSTKQVCLNRNYMETPDKPVNGGIERFTRGNLRYFLHEYNNPEETSNDKSRGDVGLRCDYWPHFSLTPSLIDSSIFKEIRFANEPSFERKFAEEYSKRGWKTAFHQEVNTRHIGRLIGERDKQNAYELNNVQQF